MVVGPEFVHGGEHVVVDQAFVPGDEGIDLGEEGIPDSGNADSGLDGRLGRNPGAGGRRSQGRRRVGGLGLEGPGLLDQGDYAVVVVLGRVY